MEQEEMNDVFCEMSSVWQKLNKENQNEIL